MSMEEKLNFQTYQDSKYFEYPETEKKVSNLVKKFYKNGTPIEVIGSGSKKKIGKKIQAGKTMSLSKLNGIIEYLPEELYIKVKACTPMNIIEEELKKKNQRLEFEPIDFGYLFLGKNNHGTAAGHISCNLSGPRRFKSGSIRDHVLGFRGVNGKGEIIKSGGVVVKNVTGYDLSKLICGSYGTLVALTEIVLKVLPEQEESKTIVLHNLKIESAMDFLNNVISSSNEISGAVFFPPNSESSSNFIYAENIFKLNDLRHGGSFTAIRMEGTNNSINERINNLNIDYKIEENDISILDTYQSKIFWTKVKNLEIFTLSKNSIIRAVMPPSQSVNLLYQLNSFNFNFYIDWGGALIWMEIEKLTEELLDALRKKVIKLGGYITVIKCSDDLNQVEEVFTIDRVRFNISQNIKKSFDPKRILNPGRMYTGI